MVALTITFLLTLLSLTSIDPLFPPQFVQGRVLIMERATTEEKVMMMMMMGRIGSRPPRCEGRCRSCGRCEAIQVPTNPHTTSSSSNSNDRFFDHNARKQDYSDYKPISWKCKCGSSIFNP